jgi:hypothetical protein
MRSRTKMIFLALNCAKKIEGKNSRIYVFFW